MGRRAKWYLRKEWTPTLSDYCGLLVTAGSAPASKARACTPGAVGALPPKAFEDLRTSYLRLEILFGITPSPIIPAIELSHPLREEWDLPPHHLAHAAVPPGDWLPTGPDALGSVEPFRVSVPPISPSPNTVTPFSTPCSPGGGKGRASSPSLPPA